jgi:hypothetical protein
MTIRQSTRVVKINPDSLSRAKGVWVWYAGAVTGTNQTSALQICSNNHLTDLHLNFDNTYGQSSKVNYQNFIDAAHTQGVKVHALFGKDTWGSNAGLSECQSWITSVLNFNSTSASNQKFDTISLDNEPYNLKTPNNFFGNVPSVTASMMNEWLNVNTQYVSQAHASGMTIGTSMPSWMNTHQQVLNAIATDPTHLTDFYKKYIDQWDYVAIMDYPLDQSPTSLINTAITAGLDYPTAQKMYIGIENGWLVKGSADGTLYGQFYMQQENIYSQVDSYFSNHPSYAGIMIDKWDDGQGGGVKNMYNGGQLKTPTRSASPTRIVSI